MQPKPVPSKAAEAIVALLIPPACRESVLGDLYERYTSPRQYLVDVVCTVPLVVMSRIRRTTNPRVLLLEASVLYLSFLASARYLDSAFLADPRGMFRLAIPPATALTALMLGEAYADPRKPSALKPVQETTLAIGLAFLAQGLLSLGNRELSLPLWIMLSGGGASLLLVSVLRMLFPRLPAGPQSAGGPAFSRAPVEQARAPVEQARVKRSEVMNPKHKSLIFWIVLVSVAIALWMVTAISSRAGRTNTRVTYSEFLQKVDAGEVAGVTIAPGDSGASQTDCLLKNGTTVRTVLPADYRDALAAMQQKLVNIEIQESSSKRTLVNATPFLLLLGLWFFMMFRMKNRPGWWGSTG